TEGTVAVLIILKIFSRRSSLRSTLRPILALASSTVNPDILATDNLWHNELAPIPVAIPNENTRGITRPLFRIGCSFPRSGVQGRPVSYATIEPGIEPLSGLYRMTRARIGLVQKHLKGLDRCCAGIIRRRARLLLAMKSVGRGWARIRGRHIPGTPCRRWRRIPRASSAPGFRRARG